MITHARKCRRCGNQGMKAKNRKWTGMETTVTFECPSCDKQVGLNALSHAGMLSAVGLIVLAIVTAYMLESPGPWGASDYILYGFVLTAGAYLPGHILLPHWRYPLSDHASSGVRPSGLNDTVFAHSHGDLIRRKILKFERYGFWRGFFTPILFITGVLGVAAIIGLLNFLLFQSP